jgi:LAS superfamily LD-carboxypeptidase LdcB
MPIIHSITQDRPVRRADIKPYAQGSVPQAPHQSAPVWAVVPDRLATSSPAKGQIPASAYLLASTAPKAAAQTTAPAAVKPAAMPAPKAKAKPIPTIGAAATATRVGKGYHVRGQLAPGQVRDLGPNTAANQAWERMQRDAAAAGIVLTEVYGYRSIAEQRRLWNASDKTGRWVARPGKSEHHTGLVFDINTDTKPFGSSPAYKWMKQHAYAYGFVQSMKHEPWHWRYDPEAVRIAVGRLKKAKR